MPRVRWIWVPLRGAHWAAAWVLLALGALPLAFLASTKILGWVMDRMPAGSLSRTGVLIGVIMLCFGSIPILLYAFSKYEWWAHLKGHGRRERRKRLSRLVQIPNVEQVLPHRVCEHRLLRTMNFNTDFLLAAPDWAVGTTIVVNGPRRGQANRPRPIAVAFEPQELGGSMDALLSAMTEGPQRGEAGLSDEDAASLRSFGVPSRWSSARAKVGLALLVIAFGWYAFHGIFMARGHLGAYLLPLTGFGLLLVSRMGGRNWWVVPGGLLYREHRPWSRKTNVGMVTQENAMLVINPGAGSGVVACRERAMVLNFNPRAGLCLLAAWMSRAKRPTREETLAFFGPDAEWSGE